MELALLGHCNISMAVNAHRVELFFCGIALFIIVEYIQCHNKFLTDEMSNC